MRSLSVSVGVLLVLLAVVSAGHKKNRDEKEGSAGCLIYRSVCTEKSPRQVAECRTTRVRRCFTVNKEGRGKRSPQLLQALLLYQALRTRHPERAEQRREVRCHLVPHQTCHNIQQPARRCSVQPVNICWGTFRNPQLQHLLYKIRFPIFLLTFQKPVIEYQTF